MSETLALDLLRSAVSGRAAAFRARTRLQPAGGPGEKIFPPTFARATYLTEYRRQPGTDHALPCVVLDTVQSQANRVEEALLHAYDRHEVDLPVVQTDFSDAQLEKPVGRITTLEAPHRIADAIFRDSELDGKPFRTHGEGKTISEARTDNATPLYRLCPTALVLGLWDSTGPDGGLGAKFERALASEVVGVGVPSLEAVERQRNRGLRRDPLGIRKTVEVLGDREGWRVADGSEKGSIRPSEINHSNVPFDSENSGVTIDYAEQTTTLSLIALRRLRFPQNGHAADPETDDAARTVLAALGLCGATLAFENGFNLRSRCLLWPEAGLTWELLDRPGETPSEYRLDSDQALALLRDAVLTAEGVGISWRKEALVLSPSDQLVELVRRSQEAAKAEPAEAD